MLFTIAPHRYDTTATALRTDALAALSRSPVVVMTEVADRARRAALDTLGPHITTTGGRGEGRGECVILTDDRRVKVIDWWTHQVTRGGGRGRLRAPMWVVVAVVQYRGTGVVTVVVGGHPPARVRHLLRFTRTHRLRPASVWLEFVDSTAHMVHGARVKYPRSEVAILFDWNLDPRPSWARRLLNQQIRRVAGFDLHIEAPDRGNHGSSVYGYAFTTMRVETIDLHQQHADHDQTRYRAKPDPFV